MKMKKYEKYKSSGVDWIGVIPEHWKLQRLKEVMNFQGGYAFSSNDYIEQGVQVILIGNLYQNQLSLERNPTFVNNAFLKKHSRFKVTKGDVLMSLTGTLGKKDYGFAILLKTEKEYLLNQRVAKLNCNKDLDVNFIIYMLQSEHFTSELLTLPKGTKQGNLSEEQIMSMVIPLLTLSEQTTIASYLDAKTSAIDRKVSLLEQKITHYQQLRKSLINETVCRGLDKNVRFKDSGIQWIGRIPEHWDVKRLKDVCGFINRGTSPTYDETGFFKVVNQATFSKGFWDESSLRFSQSLEVKPRGLLKENDILIASTGGGVLGKLYFFTRKESGYIADSHITILRDNRKNYFAKYVYYYFSEKFKLINDILAKGSTNQTELQKDWLLGFFICIPPQPEQTAIASYLDETTQKIDLIITNITTQIATLRELRKTLINDVVTGKLKVTNP